MLRLKIEDNHLKRSDSSKLLLSKRLLSRYTEELDLHRVLHCLRYDTYPDRSTMAVSPTPFLRVHISVSGSYVIPVQVSSVDEKNRKDKE